MTPDGASERVLRIRRRRRLALRIGSVGVLACFALAFVTRGRVPENAPDRPAVAFGVPPGPGADALPAPGRGDRGPTPGGRAPDASVPTRRPLRVRVVADGVAITDAVVRVVALDRATRTALPLSEAARTGSDGVAELSVDARATEECWIEVAAANSRGLRHGYEPLARAMNRGGVFEVSIPPAGRLEIHVEGLPAQSMPPYVDVRFLTPDGGWDALFTDLPATPVEDGGLFESRAIPRVQRVPLRADGSGEIPEVPDDHGIYLEFPSNPNGWLVEHSEFSGCSVPATRGEVCRIASGATGVYRVTYRRAPFLRVRVEDEHGAPIRGAEVAVGLRQPGATGLSPVFDATTTTDPSGTGELPLWTGSRLPDWAPAGRVIVAYAAGHTGRVIETAGGWYGSDVVVRLDAARTGSFVLEGTLAYANGSKAGGVPMRIVAASPWNGDAALPPVETVTDGDGAWRLEIPEAYRPIYEHGRRLRLGVDGEALEASPRGAMWRTRFPGLPRATTSPLDFELPAAGTTTRHDATLVLPPS